VVHLFGPEIRTKPPPVAEVMFGMAGVVYASGGRDRRVADENWLAGSFRSTAMTVRTEWRSDDLLVVTCQHSHEVGSAPGTYRQSIPAVGRLQGVLYGHFFGLSAASRDARSTSEKMLDCHVTAGSSCFRDINGAWIGVIWDQYKGEAHFARDCIGAETVHVAKVSDRIVFSTDLRILLKGGMLQRLDEQALAEFLHYLYVPAPRTVAEGCVSVLPGHVLTIGTSLQQEEYASRRFVQGPELPDHIDEAEIETQLPQFEAKLLAAVADCVPDTGRVALTLSGGKDSSTLAVALSKICPDRVLALTVGQGDRPTDETRDASIVCQALGLAHQIYAPTDQQLRTGISEFARVQDQPIGDPAALPYFLGLASLPDDCTVVFDGTGTDSYFGTANPAKGLWHYQRRVQLEGLVPAFLWKALLWAMSHGPAGIRRLSHFWSRPVEETFVSWEGWSASELSRLLGREVRFDDTFLWQLMRSDAASNWLSLLTRTISTVWSPPTTHRKAIHLARATGRGIRLPFIDNRLADYINDLPLEFKCRTGVNKVLLRAYMKRNLPQEIVNKPKLGLIFDVNRLLRNPECRWTRDLMRAGVLCPVRGWSEAEIHRLVESHSRSPEDDGFQHRLYALCILSTVLAIWNSRDCGLAYGDPDSS